MTATATLGAPQSTFVIDEKPVKTRRTLVITLPKLFGRSKTDTPRIEKPGRIRRVVRVTKETLLSIFAKVWNYKPVRYVSYFIGAVFACVAANLTLSVGALLLAYPFLLIGWNLVAELVFLFAYLLGWYGFMYLAIRWIFERFDIN